MVDAGEEIIFRKKRVEISLSFFCHLYCIIGLLMGRDHELSQSRLSGSVRKKMWIKFLRLRNLSYRFKEFD